MAFARKQQSTLVRNKTLGPASAVKLHNFRLHVAGDIDQGRRAVAGPRNACPGEEAGEGKGDGADVFASQPERGVGEGKRHTIIYWPPQESARIRRKLRSRRRRFRPRDVRSSDAVAIDRLRDGCRRK